MESRNIEVVPISVVIPTYNEEKNLEKCLKSLHAQNHPINMLEILVVDDDSTDGTRGIAKKYGARIIRNGAHNIDRGKSIGIENAKHEFILFMDADNVFLYKDSLTKLIKPLLIDKEIVGSYPIWFHYDEKYSSADRYCSLFGINDPFQYYTKKRDRLMWLEKTWNLDGRLIQENDDYFLIDFLGMKEIPTLGTIGFVTRKSLITKIDYSSYFYHIDSFYELVMKGYTKFAMVKTSIVHFHSDSFIGILKKLDRNINWYFKYKRRRKYQWATSNKTALIKSIIIMSTFIIPAYDAIKGFTKKRDPVWFIHPLLCFLVVMLYSYHTFTHKLSCILRRK